MSDYLNHYEATRRNDLYRGPFGPVRRALDKQASKLGQSGRHALFLKRIIDTNDIGLDVERKVLEIGAGDGWAISFKHPKLALHAIDRGNNYEEQFRKEGVAFVSMDVDGARLPYDSETFDLISLNHIIEHISMPRRSSAR